MLHAVIVNFRTPDLTIDCLRSLEPELRALPGSRATVVEGCSGDDSAERISTAIAANGWSAWAQLLPADRNGGFAYGNNLAIRPALAAEPKVPFILLLNPDTIVRAGAIGALLDFAKDRPAVGIVGSRLEHPDGTPQRSAFTFPSVLSEIESGANLGFISRPLRRFIVAPPLKEKTHRTDWVAGASMLIRREVFDRVGLMDDRYFMYFEEVDFCLAAARAGWQCWYAPASRVVHLVGQASGVTNNSGRTKRVPPYVFESRARYFRKNHGSLKKLAADVGWTLGRAMRKTVNFVCRIHSDDPPMIWRDFVRSNFLGPLDILHSRKLRSSGGTPS